MSYTPESDKAFGEQVRRYTERHYLCMVEKIERRKTGKAVDIQVCLGCKREFCPPGYEDRRTALELERKKQLIRGNER